MKKLVAGIDIGGTNTVFGLVDSSGNILYKDAIPTTKFLLPEDLVKAVKKLFENDVINVDAEIKDEE